MIGNEYYEVLSRLDEIYGGGQECGNELEQSLGKIYMYEYAYYQAREYYPNFMDDAYRDRDLHEAEYAVELDFGGTIIVPKFFLENG